MEEPTADYDAGWRAGREELRDVLRDFDFAVEIATGVSMEVNDVADVLVLAVESTYPEPTSVTPPGGSDA